MPDYVNHCASFRDPSGFVFLQHGTLYRQVNRSYAADYELLMGSGLYKKLTDEKLLIPHTEIAENYTQTPDWYKTLQPQPISFISYPYEWSVAQLKEAALLTLKVLTIAMEHGMILKDATPYNIQFHEGALIFIDSLSFEKYDPALPWIAYRQFCECFLFPLYLSHYLQTDMQKYGSVYLEGIPVALTARLLPLKSRLSMGVWLHVYLQNSVSKGRTGKAPAGHPGAGTPAPSFTRNKLQNLIRHLQSEISRLCVKNPPPSTWSNYYSETILGHDYLHAKEEIFRTFIRDIDFGSALDAGANDGYFSKVLAEQGKNVIAIDSDHRCINSLYTETQQTRDPRPGHAPSDVAPGPILPLCMDIANLSPAIGFLNRERTAFLERVNVDLVAALALVHHLVLGRNIPLDAVADLFAALTQTWLIIEFVPLTDPKAQELIKHKTQFHPYDETTFENCFLRHFIIDKKEKVPGTGRILYQMKKHAKT